MIFRALCLVALLAVPAAWGYSSGAPADVCGDMTPKHHVDPQSSASPYSVRVSNAQIRSGEAVTVDVAGNSPSDTIKGFFIQARDGANTPIGSFQVDPNDPLIQTRNCFNGVNNAITHKKIFNPPQSIRFTWVPPPGFSGSVRFYATVALNGGQFWVNKTYGDVAVV